MSETLAWMKWYPRETLADGSFMGWSLEERGAFFSLCLINWTEGSLPSDQTSLARLLHVEHSQMRALWSAIGSKWIPHPDMPGRITNPRLEQEREAAIALAKKRGTAGKAGATSRWQKEKTRHGKRMPLPSESQGVAIPVAAVCHTDPASQVQPQVQPQEQGEADSQRLDGGLAEIASTLGTQFGFTQPLGLGKDAARTRREFARWLLAVGPKATTMECYRIATEKGERPRHLSWFVGWLETVSDHRLRGTVQ